MSSITIRGLDPSIKESLRLRAAARGHSMEAEARLLLSLAVAEEPQSGLALYEAIRARVAPLGGVTLETPPREAAREALRPPPTFE